MNFGTEQQKLEYLPRVARGEIRFCLGVTEPDGTLHELLIYHTEYLLK